MQLSPGVQVSRSALFDLRLAMSWLIPKPALVFICFNDLLEQHDTCERRLCSSPSRLLSSDRSIVLFAKSETDSGKKLLDPASPNMKSSKMSNRM